MAIQYPKWKSYTFSSWEKPHIYRDPPSSIHTRKKERVEWGDVSYLIRDDDSRINENIMNYPRGVNPSVDIEYGSRNAGGSKLLTMTVPEATNPYKVNKSFRPPLFRQEDLLPLSRQRRPYTSGITNPGVRPGFVDCGLFRRMDKQDIVSATSVEKLGTYYPAYIPPTAVYKIQTPQQINVSSSIKDSLQTNANSSIKIPYLNYDFSRNISEGNYSEIKDDLYTGPIVSPLTSNGDILNRERYEDISKIRGYTLLNSLSTNPKGQKYESDNSNLVNVQKTLNRQVPNTNAVTNARGDFSLPVKIRMRSIKTQAIFNF